MKPYEIRVSPNGLRVAIRSKPGAIRPWLVSGWDEPWTDEDVADWVRVQQGPNNTASGNINGTVVQLGNVNSDLDLRGL